MASRSLIMLVLWLQCRGHVCQSCPGMVDSLRDLEERFNCLENTVQQSTPPSHPTDCNEVSEDNVHINGVYTIQPNDSRPFRALCLFDSDGKWTVIQRRVSGDTDFQRPWKSYRNGFGRLGYSSNFWLGLEKVYQLTRQRQYKLRIDLLGWDGVETHADYDIFYLDDEDSNYAIFYDWYSGTAGDHLSNFHKWCPFSTTDVDNDRHADTQKNCAHDDGPWWHNACDISNLNGAYGEDTGDEGVEWGSTKSFKETCMRIRPTFGDELDWL